MTCCIKKIDLCIGQGNDKSFLFTARDQSGALLDVSGAQEITMIVAAKVTSAPIITKTLTGGTITLNNAHQFTAAFTDTQTASLSPEVLYCEVGIVSATGMKYTLGAGPFRVQDTRIWDA